MGLDMFLSCNSPALTKRLEERNILGCVYEGLHRRCIVGYWWKANQVHNWFVENVQGGRDDCGTYEVDADQLKVLKGLCDAVIDASTLVESDECYDGERYDPSTGEWVRINRKGFVISNPKTAMDLLPTAEGFFFGSREYDDRYIEDVKYTSKLLGAILEEVSSDGEEYPWECHVVGEPDWTVQFLYHASW